MPTWQAAGIGGYDKCRGTSKASGPRRESQEKLQEWLFFFFPRTALGSPAYKILQVPNK